MKYGALIFVILLTVSLSSAGASLEEKDRIPDASFTATTVCQGLATVFTNNSTTLSGSIVGSIWDFGDGQGSTVLNPQHIFANSGIFTVKLTVINSQGDADDFTDFVTVHPSGALNFLISSTNKCVSSTFTLTNLSNIPTGNFSSYTWDFGDGSAVDHNTSTTHQYSTYGTYEVTLSTITDHSCNNTFTKTLEVFPEAAVDFSAVNVCREIELPFTNKTTVASGLVSYQWTFGDGNTSSEINPKHLYIAPGDFIVGLKVITEKGCVTQTSKSVTAHPIPVAVFNVAEPCLGSNASFVNSSTIATGTISYDWDFGDGLSSTDVSPDHLYASVNNYKVTLTAKSAQNCQNTLVKYLQVIPKAVVNFSFDDVCFGNNAEFVNSTTIANGAASFTWDFGDGTTSQATHPTHAYATFGSFDVKLVASTPSGGCPSEITKSITVNQQPIALFEAKDNCLDSLIVFKNRSTFQGPDIEYSWTFGDGKTSADSDPEHSYLSAQTYQVALKALALNGCSDSFTLPVKVSPLPLVNFIVDNVCDTSPVEFKNFTTISSGTVAYQWEFDDQSTSADRDPSHLYAQPGKYNVKVTATSEVGCVTIEEKEISVFPMPQTDFEAPPVCDSHITIFKNTTAVVNGEISNYTWDFGDETNSIVKNPSKGYLKEGSYVVKLVATTDRGCTRAIEKTVVVYPPPIAGFKVDDVCTNDPIKITNTSTISSGSLTYYWDFGDGSNDVATSPEHNYQTYGVYAIKLIVTSNTGCADSLNRAVAVFSLPEVEAGADQKVSQGYAAQLNAFGGVDYAWEPIDGLSNSNIPNPLATPLMTTQYTVYITDKYGCRNSDTVTINVDDDFKLLAANVLTPDGNGKNDTWVIENVETFGDVHVRVYDRWGKLIFKQQSYQNDWGGTSGGDTLPNGTYYYFLSFDSSDKVYKGALTIMRNKQ